MADLEEKLFNFWQTELQKPEHSEELQKIKGIQAQNGDWMEEVKRLYSTYSRKDITKKVAYAGIAASLVIGMYYLL